MNIDRKKVNYGEVIKLMIFSQVVFLIFYLLGSLTKHIPEGEIMSLNESMNNAELLFIEEYYLIVLFSSVFVEELGFRSFLLKTSNSISVSLAAISSLIIVELLPSDIYVKVVLGIPVWPVLSIVLFLIMRFLFFKHNNQLSDVVNQKITPINNVVLIILSSLLFGLFHTNFFYDFDFFNLHKYSLIATPLIWLGMYLSWIRLKYGLIYSFTAHFVLILLNYGLQYV